MNAMEQLVLDVLKLNVYSYFVVTEYITTGLWKNCVYEIITQESGVVCIELIKSGNGDPINVGKRMIVSISDLQNDKIQPVSNDFVDKILG